MKRIIVIIGLGLALAASVLPAEADDRPDFKLKCRNGRYDAKVWLAPFKVENKCAARTSSQWVEVLYEQGDAICLFNDLLEHLSGEGFPIGNTCNNLFHLGMG